jgi:CheY-like chemotaxis protein
MSRDMQGERRVSSVRRRPAHVLLVDDDPDARRIVRAFLELEGYVTSEAGDGIEALEQLVAIVAENACPILLTDLCMPRMDGWTLCARVRSDPTLWHVPIVVCSASPDGAPAAVAVLGKPIDPARLLDALARCRWRAPGKAPATAAED